MDTKRKRAILAKSADILKRAAVKHMGPGPHPDGSPQSVHAGDGDSGKLTADLGYEKRNLSEGILDYLRDNFDLFSDNNEGEEFDFIERNGKIVAFSQRTGNRIYYLQASEGGAGILLVASLKEKFNSDGLVADHVLRGSERFWERMGFVKIPGSNRNYGTAEYDWDWYPE